MLRRISQVNRTTVTRATCVVRGQQAREINGYSLFLKRVHSGAKQYANISSQLVKGEFSPKNGKMLGKAWKNLSAAEREALNKEAKAAPSKGPRKTKKSKFFKKMTNSPQVKGLSPKDKHKKLSQLWATKNNLKSAPKPKAAKKKPAAPKKSAAPKKKATKKTTKKK